LNGALCASSIARDQRCATTTIARNDIRASDAAMSSALAFDFERASLT
jgi:hypothetical protein